MFLGSVANLSRSCLDPTFDFDADPEPTCTFDADPDPISHFDVDPNPPRLKGKPPQL